MPTLPGGHRGGGGEGESARPEARGTSADIEQHFSLKRCKRLQMQGQMQHRINKTLPIEKDTNIGLSIASISSRTIFVIS